MIFVCIYSFGYEADTNGCVYQGVEVHEAQLDMSPEEQKAAPQPSDAPQRFRLRVVLRHSSLSTNMQDEEKEEDGRKSKQANKIRKKKKVKFEDDEKPLSHPSASEESDVPNGFLVKREENIKANKAMVTHMNTNKACSTVILILHKICLWRFNNN